MAMAVLSPAVLAACGSDGDSAATASANEPSTTTTTAASDSSGAPSSTDAPGTTVGPEIEGSDLRWARTNLGFVSAYVLARGNSAAIVDTGTEGSAEAIGASLVELGLTYNDVDHLVLTHRHGDHAGSIGAVMEQAVNATVYAGVDDLDGIAFDTITGLTGGEDIFGFEALSTPGHTDGHMAVIDHDAGLLVAGDAIFIDGDAVIEGPERFFSDVPTSRDTIRNLAQLSFNTLLVGHGEPIHDGADAAVALLANSLS
jgi:glyoxylase-like metal-dependent hydrolase (beta-lactamase superfamily II)